MLVLVVRCREGESRLVDVLVQEDIYKRRLLDQYILISLFANSHLTY